MSNHSKTDTHFKKLRTSILIFSMLTLVFVGAFQNCSKARFDTMNKTSQSSSSSGLGGDLEDENGLPNTPDEVENAITNCKQAVKLGYLEEVEQEIFFANPKDEVTDTSKPVCDWDAPDHMGRDNANVAARYEQVQKVNLPKGAQLCEVNFTFARQAMKYDDHFFLTFNGIVLASDASYFVEDLPSIPSGRADGQQLYTYDWKTLAGVPFHPRSHDGDFSADYCLGETCVWPKTQLEGQMYMEMDRHQMTELGLLNQGGEHEFGFVTIGDNDSRTDCQHEPLAFTVLVEYYVPNTEGLAAK